MCKTMFYEEENDALSLKTHRFLQQKPTDAFLLHIYPLKDTNM